MTAEELRVQIEATKTQVLTALQARRELAAESREALERQRLRRELEAQQTNLHQAAQENIWEQAYRRAVDADRDGAFRDRGNLDRLVSAAQVTGHDGGSVDFGHQIVKGEYTWSLVAMSWLRTALRQEHVFDVTSPDFFVDRYKFDFIYSPFGYPIDDETDESKKFGSLAIRSHPPNSANSTAFRYSIFVKRHDGSFVQWGATKDVIRRCLSVEVYGPDVHVEGSAPSAIGIFGLTHEQLLQSEWVSDDTLTLKFVLEVRPLGTRVTESPFKESVDVPEPSLHRDVETLLEEASSSDVRFSVQGEDIRAHSQVLCARSEVLRKQLNSGMQESMSKVIMVGDCNVATFKSFLKFLYTDKLPTIQDLATEQASQAEKEVGSRHPSQMEALWAVSHKYQAGCCQRSLHHLTQICQSFIFMYMYRPQAHTLTDMYIHT